MNNVEEDVWPYCVAFLVQFLVSHEDLRFLKFEVYTKDGVLKEVANITEDQFHFLSDSGNYVNAETNETRHFDGHLFDEVVINDLIQQFLKKKDQFSSYLKIIAKRIFSIIFHN